MNINPLDSITVLTEENEVPQLPIGQPPPKEGNKVDEVSEVPVPTLPTTEDTWHSMLTQENKEVGGNSPATGTSQPPTTRKRMIFMDYGVHGGKDNVHPSSR
jgi:hypothetical protein